MSVFIGIWENNEHHETNTAIAETIEEVVTLLEEKTNDDVILSEVEFFMAEPIKVERRFAIIA